MDKFYNKISQHLLTKLKEIYPNGYDVGVIVSVPVDSVTITHALIDGNYKDYWAPYGGYDVKGKKGVSWGRYVSLENIIPVRLYNEVKVFELHYSDKHEIVKRTMVLFNEYLLSVLI